MVVDALTFGLFDDDDDDVQWRQIMYPRMYYYYYYYRINMLPLNIHWGLVKKIYKQNTFKIICFLTLFWCRK